MDLMHVCSSRDHVVGEVRDVLRCIDCLVRLPDVPAIRPFDIIKGVLDDNAIISNAECIIALAYAVRCVHSDELRAHIYANLATVLRTDTDLFRFVHWTGELNAFAYNSNPDVPQPPGAHSFGAGMRHAIERWYHARTALDLCRMVGRRRGQFKWTHRDLITLCHVRFEPNDERLPLVRALFRRGAEVVRQMADPNVSIVRTPVTQCMEQWMRLKMCEDAVEAARLFREGRFDHGHVPSHLLTSAEFWRLAAQPLEGSDTWPLSYAEGLQIFLTLNDCGALETDVELRALMLRWLTDERAVGDASRVQPLHVLSLLNGYVMDQRPAEKVKAKFYRKKRNSKHGSSSSSVAAPARGGNSSVKKADMSFVAALTKAVSLALDNVTIGLTRPAEMVVLLDLSMSVQRRRVFKMEHVNCLQAMALLAQCMVRHCGAKVYALTDRTDELRHVDLMPMEGYQGTMRKCREVMVYGCREWIAECENVCLIQIVIYVFPDRRQSETG